MTKFSQAYEANEACQEYERAKEAALKAYEDRPRGPAKEQPAIDDAARDECYIAIHVAAAVRDGLLAEVGLQVAEGFGKSDWEVDLEPAYPKIEPT